MALASTAMRLPAIIDHLTHPGLEWVAEFDYRYGAVRRSPQAIRTGSACAASPCSSTGSRDFGSKGGMM